MGWWGFPRYVPVAERREKALREARKLARKGRKLDPVVIAGRAIAATFWGKAWCDNLESYSDFSNRLPRGRAYVRNGLVLDLRVKPGQVTSLVSGSRLYRVTIEIRRLPRADWKSIRLQCGGQINSLVELLQGRLSKSVMEIVTRRDGGLFPSPKEIAMSCTCPDWAGMCKHVAATLYSVGSRLDRQPDLLFTLRRVDHLELIAQAASPASKPASAGKKTIAEEQLAEVFGIEMESAAAEPFAKPPRAKPRLKPPVGKRRQKGKQRHRKRP